MALIQINYRSDALKRTVPINVILPTDKVDESGYCNFNKRFKTLYLLHGFYDNYEDWLCNSSIRKLAEKRNIAVVMPSGENSFYIDMKSPNCNFGKFVGEELVNITRQMFPLSDKREDTFIAGLSMGGFGALRNGLFYNETFGYIGAMSSALNMFETPVGTPGRLIANEDWVFGNLEAARKSTMNPRVCMEQLSKKHAENPSIPIPKIYMACGLQDGLLGVNRIFKTDLKDNGFDIYYTERDGAHNWDFWTVEIEKILTWLPIEDAPEGINGGHVTL